MFTVFESLQHIWWHKLFVRGNRKEMSDTAEHGHLKKDGFVYSNDNVSKRIQKFPTGKSDGGSGEMEWGRCLSVCGEVLWIISVFSTLSFILFAKVLCLGLGEYGWTDCEDRMVG